MGLDIRWPIGFMFSFIGALMAIYGAATGGSPVYQRSLGQNVNLIWGIVLLIFGVLMLWGAMRGKNSDKK